MKCPDCEELLNDLWVCEFCQVDYEPSQELKNKVIREFLDKHAKKFIELYEWETTNIEEILKQLEGEDDD